MSELKKSIIRSAKGELIALALLIPLAIILGAVIMALPNFIPSETEVAYEPTTEPAIEHIPSPAIGVAGASDVQNEEQSPTQTITLTIEAPAATSTHLIPSNAEVTVAELMTKANEMQLVTIDSKDYGGSLGVFIESINGVVSDSAQQKYWHLYINGELSPVGASSALVTPSDYVAWKYEHEHEME